MIAQVTLLSIELLTIIHRVGNTHHRIPLLKAFVYLRKCDNILKDILKVIISREKKSVKKQKVLYHCSFNTKVKQILNSKFKVHEMLSNC